MKSATRRQLLTALAAKDQSAIRKNLVSENLTGEILGEPSSKRRYWIFAASAFALLLISAVLWLSWRDPAPDVAASEGGANFVNSAQSSAAAVPTSSEPKPEAGVSVRKPASVRAGAILRNAAGIEPEGRSVSLAEGPSAKSIPEAQPSSASDPPPSVEIAASPAPNLVAGITAESATLPTLDARVSQGITQGALIHEVPAVYPPQARMQRLAGSVVVDATVGADGAVRSVKLVSGPLLLATAATDAIRLWRYSPALLNGTPIEVQKRITVVFKLP
jgi:TonB family protein